MLILNTIDDEITEKIHDGSFPYPQFDDKIYISKKTVVEHGKVIAIGAVKITTEGILITDQNAPLITRARCSEAVIEALKQDVKLAGLNECHVFVKEPKVIRFLNHLGFNPSKGGQPLVIFF